MKKEVVPKGAGVMLFDKNRRLLLLKRAAVSVWMPEKWGLPGGKIEKDELPSSAAIRETQEETGLMVEKLRLLSVDEKVAIYFSNTYSGELKIDWEHTDWKWVHGEELSTYDVVPGIREIYELAVTYATE